MIMLLVLWVVKNDNVIEYIFLDSPYQPIYRNVGFMDLNQYE